MMSKTKNSLLGLQGEDAAAKYLEERRIKVLDRHYQTRWGEIDLICRDRETWVFVEVKTRTRVSQPSAADVLTVTKQKKMIGAALSYMKKNRLIGQNVRFD